MNEDTIKAGILSAYDLVESADQVHLYRSEGKKERVLSPANDVQIDTLSLCLVSSSLTRYSFRIYIYLLSLLKDNRRSIKVHSTELRNKSTDLSKRQVFDEHLEILLSSGLVWRYRSHEFYINPLYAWVGDRALYFDVDRLPFKASPQQQDETND